MTNKEGDLLQDVESFMQENIPARAERLKEAGYQILLEHCLDAKQKLNLDHFKHTVTQYPEIKKWLASSQFQENSAFTKAQKDQMLKIIEILAAQGQKLFTSPKSMDQTISAQNNKPRNKR